MTIFDDPAYRAMLNESYQQDMMDQLQAREDRVSEYAPICPAAPTPAGQRHAASACRPSPHPGERLATGRLSGQGDELQGDPSDISARAA